MRYIGIDYGTKRVGIALSDEQHRMAFPYAVLKNSEALLDDLAALIDREKVDRIVVGHSKHTDGTDNEVQTAIESFITSLSKRTRLPIDREVEWYSTKAAERIQGRTDKIDASAAALILDSYLTKHA